MRRIIRQTDGVMVTGCAVPHVWKEVSPGFRVRLFEPDAGEAELLARLRAEGELRAAAKLVRRAALDLTPEQLVQREVARKELAMQRRMAAMCAREEAAAQRRIERERARKELALQRAEQRAIEVAEQRAIRAAERAAKRAARTPEEIGPWEMRRLRQAELAVALREADREANRKFAERFRVQQLVGGRYVAFDWGRD